MRENEQPENATADDLDPNPTGAKNFWGPIEAITYASEMLPPGRHSLMLRMPAVWLWNQMVAVTVPPELLIETDTALGLDGVCIPMPLQRFIDENPNQGRVLYGGIGEMVVLNPTEEPLSFMVRLAYQQVNAQLTSEEISQTLEGQIEAGAFNQLRAARAVQDGLRMQRGTALGGVQVKCGDRKFDVVRINTMPDGRIGLYYVNEQSMLIMLTADSVTDLDLDIGGALSLRHGIVIQAIPPRYYLRREKRPGLRFDVEVLSPGSEDVAAELQADLDKAQDDEFVLESAYSPAGHRIGSADRAQRLCDELGIRPELASPDAQVCSIGKSDIDGKWYGWSHRALNGFAIGDVLAEDDCATHPGSTAEWLAEHPEDDLSLPVGFECIDDAACRRAAIAFADNVG